MRESKKLRLLCLAALFAGAIAVTTAYLLHIPIPTGGYIHLGDALIYLAACLLPAPYAVGAAMVGAGLADLLTAPLWVVPTLLIKALVALLFTSRGPRLLCPRNGAALLLACLLSPAAYGLAACLLLGGVNAFWPQFLGTLVQAVGSGAVFAVLALALDRAGGKARLAPHSQGYPILTRGGIVMKRVKITVLKTTLDRELAEEYGAEGLTACPMLREGQVFYADYAKPEGFCDEAWKAVYQYAFALAHGAGEGLFYYGDWIRKPGVAICSCNDGLRPVIFKLEATDEESPLSYTPVQ